MERKPIYLEHEAERQDFRLFGRPLSEFTRDEIERALIATATDYRNWLERRFRSNPRPLGGQI